MQGSKGFPKACVGWLVNIFLYVGKRLHPAPDPPPMGTWEKLRHKPTLPQQSSSRAKKGTQTSRLQAPTTLLP